MRNILIWWISLILIIQLVSAAEVCVVVDYGDQEEKPDSKCIDIDEGKNGYELLNELSWRLEWKDFGYNAFAGMNLGHGLCSIDDIGNDPDVCWGTDTWNLNLVTNNEWLHLPVAFDADGGCWNKDPDSTVGHYCTKDDDVVGLAFGGWGAEPEMFKVNVSGVYVDGEKERRARGSGGKIREVSPGSEVKINFELENLYFTTTNIDVTDISIEGTIEEINDGSDIVEELSEFDILADKKETKTLEFQIPLDVENKDRLLKIEIKARDDAGIRYNTEITYDLEVKKEVHKVNIIKAELDKDDYICGTEAILDLSLLNIGASDETINLQIKNEELNLEISEVVRLDDAPYTPSSSYQKKFDFTLPTNIENTDYSIEITARYASLVESEKVDLIVRGCQTVVKTGSKEPSSQVGDTELIITSKEYQVTSEEIPVEEQKNNTLLLSLSVILGILIMAVVALAAIFILKRK
ncbi:MAG: hypothetical protein U9O94_09005 [Nanoarchaeota archaeon]|nr:hypothetical protein [Nanoarchaeota archaeon]